LETSPTTLVAATLGSVAYYNRAIFTLLWFIRPPREITRSVQTPPFLTIFYSYTYAVSAKKRHLRHNNFENSCAVTHFFLPLRHSYTKALHLTMVTTYGLKPSQYNGFVQSEVKMDDLFS
jgi:hypothetical protein